MPDATEPFVGVLGPVVLVRDGMSRTPPSPVVRALLGALAIASPAALSPECLVTTVWGSAPPRDAKATLQLTVFRLRRWLKESVGDLMAVRTELDGYRLDLGTATSDLARFRALTTRLDNSYETLAKAMSLWRGSPLADVPHRRTNPQVVTALREEHATALRRCAAAAIAEGLADCAIALLRPLCAGDRLDEEAHALLIEALTATGQHAAALGEFDRIRRRLSTELGMQPGIQLRTIYQRLLGPSNTAAETSRNDAPGVDKALSWHGPRPLGTLIGRDEERTALARLVRDHRIVTISGPGGVGKTVLALDVARAVWQLHPGGIAVATLSGAASVAEARLTVGRALGIANSATAKASAPYEAAIAGRQALLVLDNCEHLLPDLAPIVQQLVAAAPEITVLTTSQQSLGISGEVVWRLDPLRPPENPATLNPATPAVELFLRRAVEAVPGFAVNDADLVRVSRICRRLDGLPLALELAAAQLRTLPLTALDERLAKDLNVLSARVHRDDVRHSSLDAVFDWSCRLLDDPERLLLAQLSFFRDGFSLDAAEKACASTTLLNAEILPTLAALVERSLVQPYDTPHGRRYRLLETVRELAAKRLAGAAPPPLPGRRAKPEPQYSRTTVARFWPN